MKLIYEHQTLLLALLLAFLVSCSDKTEWIEPYTSSSSSEIVSSSSEEISSSSEAISSSSSVEDLSSSSGEESVSSSSIEEDVSSSSVADLSSSSVESSSSSIAYNLTCENFQTTGTVGTPITKPIAKCNGEVVDKEITNTGAITLDWNYPKQGTYSNVTIIANCGEDNVPKICGTLTVSYPRCDIDGDEYDPDPEKDFRCCKKNKYIFSTHTCVEDKIYTRCGALSYYNPEDGYCDNGTAKLKETCGTDKYNPLTHFCDVRDDKVYKYVTIGTQTWMAENLNYAVDGSLCYDNEPDNCAIYGMLYNWETANNVCPDDWHLPDNDEWGILMETVVNTCNDYSAICNGAGKKLKATNGWSGTSGNGSDNYGFAGLPGGTHLNPDVFESSKNGYWWSATERSENTDHAYHRGMYGDNDDVGIAFGSKTLRSRSVRCVMD